MTTNADEELPYLELKPLQRALSQFVIAINAWAANPGDPLIRDAVIQRFEFTYELSIKMLRRYLRLVSISEEEVDEFRFRSFIQRASDLKLIKGDLASWVAFRQARNDTVHTYNETRAIQVAEATTDFAFEARFLLEALKEKIHS